MIKKSKYKSNLWGKNCLSFEIDTLKDLRQLKKDYPAKQLYKQSTGCTSFRTLDLIKKELEKITIKTEDSKELNSFDYHMNKGDIVKLTNPYVFICETLRGYSNNYKIQWHTEKEIITVKTKNNLWDKVTVTVETDKNKYAENTVRPVKLVSLHPQILTGVLGFNVVYWSGGNTTTYNDSVDKEYIKTFNKNLFYGE